MNWNYELYSMIVRFRGYNIDTHLRACMESQYFTRTKLEEIQTRKLIRLLSHAYQNVPYYRRIMDEHGLRPRDFQTKDDLPRLPVLTKDIIRDNYSDLISVHARKCIVSKTGGSTGTPLSFHLDTDSIAAGEGAQLRCMGWAGYRYGDRIVAIGGSSLGISNRREGIKAKLFRKLANTIPLAAVHMDATIMEKYYRQILVTRPTFIRGYPSAIFLLAHYILENNLSVIRPKAVFTTAERLHEKHREVIEKVFRCKIFDGYGCRDGGGHAFECDRHMGLHLSDEVAISEIIPDSPNDLKTGEILFTDLHNYAMPFIRYRPGDRVRLSANKCACGRELTLIEDVMGRSSDILLFKDRSSLSMPAATLIFREFSFLQYQLHQVSETELLVNLVYSPTSSNDEANRLVSILERHLGQDIRIHTRRVGSIPLTDAGKAKICISDLPENKVW